MGRQKQKLRLRVLRLVLITVILFLVFGFAFFHILCAVSETLIDRVAVNPPRGSGWSQINLGGGVRPASQNPYPIYDLRNSISYLRLLRLARFP